jgi:hypothetical protein
MDAAALAKLPSIQCCLLLAEYIQQLRQQQPHSAAQQRHNISSQYQYCTMQLTAPLSLFCSTPPQSNRWTQQHWSSCHPFSAAAFLLQDTAVWPQLAD